MPGSRQTLGGRGHPSARLRGNLQAQAQDGKLLVGAGHGSGQRARAAATALSEAVAPTLSTMRQEVPSFTPAWSEAELPSLEARALFADAEPTPCSRRPAGSAEAAGGSRGVAG